MRSLHLHFRWPIQEYSPQANVVPHGMDDFHAMEHLGQPGQKKYINVNITLIHKYVAFIGINGKTRTIMSV